MMRAPLCLTLLLVMTACAPERSTEEAPKLVTTPPPASNWIEVPLAENAFREHAGGYREDTLSVTIAPGPGLEVNLGMKSGAAMVYSWNIMSPSRRDDRLRVPWPHRAAARRARHPDVLQEGIRRG